MSAIHSRWIAINAIGAQIEHPTISSVNKTETKIHLKMSPGCG